MNHSQIIARAGAIVTLLLAVGTLHALEPRLDGFNIEWTPADLIATDPAGDATGAFDVQHVYATNRGTRLFLRFDIGATRNLQSGNASDGTLRIQIAMPNARFLTIDTRNRTLWRDNIPGNSVSWPTVGYSSAPSYAANDFEVAVDLSFFGVVTGDAISINFSSSDSLAASAPYVLSNPATSPIRRSAARAAGAAFRIASVNTEQTGLLNSTRRPLILRLCDAMNADIYCFQEEYDSSAAQIDQHLTSADPTEDGANWNVFKNNDCVIATRSPILPLPIPNSATAGAIIDLPEAGTTDSIVVFSIHPKCCGYIGSSEDTQRISQMNGLIGVLNGLRTGSLGAAYEPYRDVPAIIIGDWNLVGSATPLNLVLNSSPGSPAMTDAVPAQLIGEDVTTWRGSGGGPGTFTPGRLDFLTYTALLDLNLLNAFVLDSATLNSAELSALGLQAGDSAATDHNMLVADFAFEVAPPPPCDGDADGDGSVTFADVTSVLANWGNTGPAGDADHNQSVDFADITAVLAHWGDLCP